MSEVVPNPKQREVVTMGIGQCGIQMGLEMWKLYSKEHYITLDGRAQGEETSEDISFTTFFLENSQGQFVPRNLFFDLEPSVCDQIQNTRMKNMFDPEKTVYSAEDGANVYARGKFIASKYVHPKMFLQLRKTAESCNAMNYIHLLHSASGGTGSGYANKLCDDIVDSLGFRNTMAFTVMPSYHYQTSPVEITNTLLWMSEGLVEGSIKYNLNFDNQSMYRFIKQKFKPTYWHVNQLISFTISGITARMRFSGDLSFDNTDLETNMIPYKSLNMLIANYAPLNFGKRAQTTSAITNAAFNQGEFIGCDLMASQYLCCALLYRGRCSPLNISRTIADMKKFCEFVPWMPTGFKVGIAAERVALPDDSPWENPARAVTKLCNHGSIAHMIKRLRERYEPTFEYKAFFHHFIGAGMEEGAFTEAMEQADLVINQYDSALSMESQE